MKRKKVLFQQCDWTLLTERVGESPDGEGEATAGGLDTEEDHGHVPRGAHGSPGRARLPVVHIALLQRQRVVLGTAQLLPLHHPPVTPLSARCAQRARGEGEE